MATIELEQINKRYENAEKNSVNNFNIHIHDKEFIVFVGPSGCGKSTTLRMIAGLEDITEGKLVINGQVMNDVAPKDRDIAMVFQNYALYPHMTIFDNMAFGLKLRKYDKTEIRKRVENAAEILGLKEFLQRRPAALSGGQRQRVALGRAIVRDAPIFLMDEPLSNLDAKLRISMRAEITKLHKRLGTTTIYVTHDQTEAMTMADRVVVMSVGKIQQIGTPKEIYNYPKNEFVAGFIGAPAMNFIDVTFKDGSIMNDDFSLKLPDVKRQLLIEQGYDGQQLVLGIRPEDLHTEASFVNVHKEATATAEVEVAELLGAVSQLYLTITNTKVVATVNSEEHQNHGDSVVVGFDLAKAHFFDKKTTNAIMPSEISSKLKLEELKA